MTTTVYRRAGSIFFLCRFHPLEQGAQWVLILVSRYRRFFADSHSDTVSLTTAHRCGTVAGKEIKNSGNSGTRIRKPCGFFTPERFYVGRAAAIQDPLGKAARRLFPVFDLPTPTGAARKNVSPWSSHETGDVL
ncbi:hypothetical protein OK116_06220 [Xylella fastidiosa subsp. fastidiosa]|uniref:hypothetical protein n=1 Tax=Xylella fastidiosa TaxID=2371 RepID=UPI001E347879|nr:hypothetical protein [Xylella fastidiosa]WCF16352.1 hypothetical protein OK116_06220 [Xylella fastidiosa subsp. fastidiosa]WCF18538.1 hypothetical protein OK118_06010 [Xylella fastidiosa subsp. fastidiosa]